MNRFAKACPFCSACRPTARRCCSAATNALWKSLRRGVPPGLARELCLRLVGFVPRAFVLTEQIQPGANMGAWYRPDRDLRILPGTPEAYLIGTGLVLLAALLRWALGLVGVALVPFTTFNLAVLFATFLGGAGVGSVAVVLGGIISWWAFIPGWPFSSTHGEAIEVAVYIVACAPLVWGAENYRRLLARLGNEENLRKLAVDELAHRLKNKIATIQSIISYQLRDQPKVRGDIIARLEALSATDDLIMAAQGQGADVRSILTTELGPYDLSRMLIRGPDVLLSPKLALTMALLFHELATNAAKHGALSTTAGKLSVVWSVADRTLTVEWREVGGPAIGTPTRRGFGLRLLSNALDQFGGIVETTFDATGIVCRMNAVLDDVLPPAVNRVAGAS